VPQLLPGVPSTQASAPVQAVTPPSAPPTIGQQGCPAPPQAPQVPGIPAPPPVLRPAQANPAPVQVPALPAPQQDWPAAPQVPQVFPVGAGATTQPWVAAVQAMAPGQQACPVPPQGVHMPGIPAPPPVLRPAQASPAPVQVPLPPAPQQGWPAAPQVPQVFPVGAGATTQPSVAAVQAILPAQQACPVPPQGLHMPGTPLLSLRPVQTRPAVQSPLLPLPQQTWPAPPQGVALQVAPVGVTRQLRPVLQSVAPLQQG
jgi:hypothetical protein